MAERPSPERIAARIRLALERIVPRRGSSYERDKTDALAALDELLAALDAESEKARRLEHERDFWKNRYDTQHGTVHRLEDALDAASQRAERYAKGLNSAVESAQKETEAWKDMRAQRDAAEAERDDARRQLAQARQLLDEWRRGTDWADEGSGQMPDRVLILRLEDLLAALPETPPNHMICGLQRSMTDWPCVREPGHLGPHLHEQRAGVPSLEEQRQP